MTIIEAAQAKERHEILRSADLFATVEVNGWIRQDIEAQLDALLGEADAYEDSPNLQEQELGEAFHDLLETLAMLVGIGINGGDTNGTPEQEHVKKVVHHWFHTAYRGTGSYGDPLL